MHCWGRVQGAATCGVPQTFVGSAATRVDGCHGDAAGGGGLEAREGEVGRGLQGDDGSLPGNRRIATQGDLDVQRGNTLIRGH